MILEILPGEKKFKGLFMFNLKAKNGEIIATSEHYTRKASIKKVHGKYFPLFKLIDKTIKP